MNKTNFLKQFFNTIQKYCVNWPTTFPCTEGKEHIEVGSLKPGNDNHHVDTN